VVVAEKQQLMLLRTCSVGTGGAFYESGCLHFIVRILLEL